jgi:arylsulfatase A-like enzyme
MTHFVMIDCHDLGQHLACYGWDGVPSPNLDRIAATGVRFKNSFGTAPQCCSSRAERYAHANGMFGLAHPPFNWRMHDGELHLSRLLQEAGYHIAQIGMQHVTTQAVEPIKQLGLTQERPDLQMDSVERENLAGQAAYHDIERDLRQRLLAWMQATGDPLLEGPIASPYYDEAKRLLLGNDG